MYTNFMVSMLIELKIENFGIIETQRIRLGRGLNIITGETGSGKSLVMNALDVVLGARTAHGLVRNGAHKATIEAVFEVNNPEIKKLIPNQADLNSPYLELRREITTEGRSRIYCNGELSNLQQIRNLANHLIEIHGQHEHQRILEPESHIEFLDHFSKTEELSNKFSEVYHRYSSIKTRLRNVNLESEERENRREFLHFCINEIEDLNPIMGEFEELNNEKALIQNSGRLFQDICNSYELLREDEEAILDRLNTVVQMLEPYAKLLPSAQEFIANMQEASYLLEASADYLRNQKDLLKFSPERLEDLNERISSYHRLHKKYGGSTQTVINTKNKYLNELGSIEMSTDELLRLEKELEEIHKVLHQKAEELSRLRRASIPKLEAKLIQELEHLGMSGAKIKINIKREVELNTEIKYNQESDICDDTSSEKFNRETITESKNNKYSLNEKGYDRVEFLLISNPGETPRPLRKIVSGGELSRISLAIESIFFKQRPLASLVFDEVDTGVGGEIAHAIGSRLKELSEYSQIIVVTHLPQIARLAHHHFCVVKKYLDGRAYTQINQLQENERLKELARMLGGETHGSIVIEHARELLLSTI